MSRASHASHASRASRARSNTLRGWALALALTASTAGCDDKAGTARPSESTSGASAQASSRHIPRLIPPPATENVMQLLAPWKTGNEVQGCKIVAIYGVYEGSIWVLLKRRHTLVHLELTRAGEGPEAPYSSPPYAVYVSGRGSVTEGELLTLAETLGSVLKANANVPVPADLQTFHRGARLPDPP